MHVPYKNVCGKHQWRGYGECPTCFGIRVGEQCVKIFRKRYRKLLKGDTK